MPSRSLLPHIVTIVSLIIVVLIAVSGLPRSFAAEQAPDVPAWLKAHVGEGDGQIAPVVLQRARALYLQKMSDGAVKNPCYFAMDATRPGGCWAPVLRHLRSRPVVSRGFSGSRQRPQFARHREFRKRNECAKNFGNAMDSKLTTGGAYGTDEEITSFKGYYRNAAGKYAALAARSCSSTAKATQQTRDLAPSAGIRPRC